MKDSALKKLQGNVKRRSGTIGIAPEMLGKVAALPASVAAQPKIAAPNIENSAPVPAAPADDKAARLAAIRARNAAQPPADVAPVAPVEVVPSAAPVDDKATRLAAIRARNAAKNTADGDGTP